MMRKMLLILLFVVGCSDIRLSEKEWTCTASHAEKVESTMYMSVAPGTSGQMSPVNYGNSVPMTTVGVVYVCDQFTRTNQ